MSNYRNNPRALRSSTAVVVALAATSALVMLVNLGSTPRQPLMVLERVVVVGKSALNQPQLQQVVQVKQLPRVLVVGRSVATEADIQLARARECSGENRATAFC